MPVPRGDTRRTEDSTIPADTAAAANRRAKAKPGALPAPGFSN
ncbi:hypothetical protein QP162_04175 [Sphingomonas aurantiaca]